MFQQDRGSMENKSKDCSGGHFHLHQVDVDIIPLIHFNVTKIITWYC